MAISERDNLLNIFRRQGIHHAVPSFSMCPAMVDKFAARFGHRDYAREFGFQMQSSGLSMLKQPFTDWKQRYFPQEQFLPTTNFSIWGVAHESTPESMHMSRMYFPMKPFTTLKEYEDYPYPLFAEDDLPELKRRIAALHAQGIFVCEIMQCTIWETAWYMKSMEEMMVGMMTDDEGIAYHLDRVTELAARRAAAFAEADADFIFLGDDIGMQRTIMMSRELYGQWLKPRLHKVIAAARAKKPDVIIGYHSCGYVEPLITDLLEAGIDVLNPVQPECMVFKDIYEKYGDRLSFWGTLGTQTLFPYGTPEAVYEETLRNLRMAGQRGGLLATPTHLLEPEVPLDNVIAYVQACRDFS